jgi:hypothetical protein
MGTPLGHRFWGAIPAIILIGARLQAQINRLIN